MVIKKEGFLISPKTNIILTRNMNSTGVMRAGNLYLLEKTVGNNKDISHCIIVNQKRFSLGFFKLTMSETKMSFLKIK